MRSFAMLAGFFAASAIASPLNNLVERKEKAEPCDDDAPPCMTYDQAQRVADNFAESIASYSDALADRIFTVDFVDYTDSVSELINSGCTGPAVLGEPTFDGLEAFKAGQGAQPEIPFEQLNLWHTCDTVVMRWRTALEPEFVTGIIVMETEYQKDNAEEPFLIDTVYSEFNSGAWLVDLGVFKPGNCSAEFQPEVTNNASVVNNKRSIDSFKMI